MHDLPELPLTRIRTTACDHQALDLPTAFAEHGIDIAAVPFVIRVLAENVLRARALRGPAVVGQAERDAVLNWQSCVGADLPLFVSRVILPDSSGVPVLQDLAALRDALARAGGDPRKVDTHVPVDLVVDHSLQVDVAGRPDAIRVNMRRELGRNAERYEFIGWAQRAFRGLRVFPPGSGIIHQVNLERIATVVATDTVAGRHWAFPDFVIGGDSHTPMVGGMGVLGWGVGGIDAEAALLGHAYTFPLPEVVGVRLVGMPQPLVWTTDLALLVTERLRREQVSNCAVEFFGPVVRQLSVPERATLSNMAPEYGATCGYFPVDARTLEYLRNTGRDAAQIELVQAYCRRVGLWRDDPDAQVPRYARVVEIDLAQARPSLAGPQRPQERLALPDVRDDFQRRLALPMTEGGFGATRANETPGTLPQGAVVIAAITSCTNTSNPQVMVAAGLAARNAARRGMTPPAWVKTSLAPGSPMVMQYLQALGLAQPLAELGFHLVGYGCTTCGGKSGPLPPEVAQEIEQRGLVAAAVLSGNRNFPGRIHKLVRANYIGAPPLVVAYALAGRIDVDLDREPIGHDADGREVFWRELLPSNDEVAAMVRQVEALGEGSPHPNPPPEGEGVAATSAPLRGVGVAATSAPLRGVGVAATSSPLWGEAGRGAAPSEHADRFPWNPQSQYLREPPFFVGNAGNAGSVAALANALRNARVLAAFGDGLTTDAISPSSEIPVDTPAGQYLIAAGIAPRDFNTYVGRRGNAEVMARGTFANVRLRNLLTPDREGGWTLHFPEGQCMTIYEAAQRYLQAGTATIVLGGKEYGTGSSRDWAAKGSALLGIKAVIAESFERIHRANLIGMGVLPLQFMPAQGWRQLGIAGSETFTFGGVEAGIEQGRPIRITATRADGTSIVFEAQAQTRTTAERRLMAAGGIPAAVLQALLDPKEPACA